MATKKYYRVFVEATVLDGTPTGKTGNPSVNSEGQTVLSLIGDLGWEHLKGCTIKITDTKPAEKLL